MVQYKKSDPFSEMRVTSVGEVEFIVKVKNQTGDSVVGSDGPQVKP